MCLRLRYGKWYLRACEHMVQAQGCTVNEFVRACARIRKNKNQPTGIRKRSHTFTPSPSALSCVVHSERNYDNSSDEINWKKNTGQLFKRIWAVHSYSNTPTHKHTHTHMFHCPHRRALLNEIVSLLFRENGAKHKNDTQMGSVCWTK